MVARLPLVNEILRSAKEKTQTLEESVREALKPILNSCKAKAEDLEKLFQEVVRKDDDKWYDRYRKAVGTLGKGDKVECLMEEILKDIQVVACERGSDFFLADPQTHNCLKDLRTINPRDKKRIEETKGGLLQDSYSWILEHPYFRKWRDEEQDRVFWITGNPGKGKTMLLCGIINELGKPKAETHLLSYFFPPGYRFANQ